MNVSMPSGVRPVETTSSELTTGQLHGGFVNAIVRQHIGLAFGGCAAVAAHGGEDERAGALRFPVIHGRARDGRDIRNAPAADADRDSGPGVHARSELARGQLAQNFAANVGNGAIGKVLADGKHPRRHTGTGMFSGYLLALSRPVRGNSVLMLFHPHARSVEHHAFRFQPQALFEAVFARQRDLSPAPTTRCQGSPRAASQRPDHLPRASRKARRARHIAVGGHFAFRNFANRVADNFEHGAYCARYQASVRRRPSSSEYCGSWPRSRRAAVVSACESRTSPARGGP